MNQRRNKKGNQKITWDKQKWKHNIPKLIDAAKSVLRVKFITINAYIKKISNKLEKEQTKLKVSRRKKIIKIRTKTNKIEKQFLKDQKN